MNNNLLPNPFLTEEPETPAAEVATDETLPCAFADYDAEEALALLNEQSEWPRGFDPEGFVSDIEPSPLFLSKPADWPEARKVRPGFLNALFDISQARYAKRH